MIHWLNAKRLLYGFAVLGLAIYAACPQHIVAQDSPRPGSNPQTPSPQAAAVEGSANISGVVLDVSGASVAGAKVSLTDKSGSQPRTLLSGPNGEFMFNRIAAGTYLVSIDAPGLEPFKSEEILVTAQQTYDMPKITLSIATRRTEMNISPTEVIADAQVKAEEKQRILGILPNFYTSYLFDAVPLNTKQKFSLAFRDTLDPIRFIGSGVAAAIQQSNNSYAGYGQGAAGYGKRFAAAYGDGLSGDILSHAVFPSLFHQDPRYFYQGTGTIKSRLLHAMSFALVTRNDHGGLMPNYSYLLGDIGAGALSNLYYPHADRGAGLVFTNAAIGIAGRAGGTIIREFFLKHVTTNVHGNGKP